MRLGSGGRLYKDAREANADRSNAAIAEAVHASSQRLLAAHEEDLSYRFPGEDDDGAVRFDGEGSTQQPDREPPQPKMHADTLPSEPPPQRWIVERVEPPAPPTPPPTPRDWRQINSTVLEVAGMGVLSYGLSMLWIWLGVATLGLCIILLGINAGIPPTPRPRP